MPQRALDKLTEAQHRRALARVDFFHRFLEQLLILIVDPSAIESVRETITAESQRVSESLDATDEALIDRVTAIVWKEQATRADQVAELRREIAAGSEP